MQIYKKILDRKKKLKKKSSIRETFVGFISLIEEMIGILNYTI